MCIRDRNIRECGSDTVSSSSPLSLSGKSGQGLRVLHALTSLDERYGGPLRLVLDLSARAEALGLESEVLGLGDPEVHDNPLDPSKIHSVPVGKFGGSYGYSPELRKWLAENVDRFGGVVVHGAWTYHGWACLLYTSIS